MRLFNFSSEEIEKRWSDKKKLSVNFNTITLGRAAPGGTRRTRRRRDGMYCETSVSRSIRWCGQWRRVVAGFFLTACTGRDGVKVAHRSCLLFVGQPYQSLPSPLCGYANLFSLFLSDHFLTFLNVPRSLSLTGFSLSKKK